MRAARDLIIVTVAAWVAHVGAAHAQARERVERVAMSYVVPDGCPSETAFAERLRERAPVVQIERGAQRTFDIGIERGGSGFHGTLAIRSASGALVREVEGQTCEDVVRALVVVAALAIEAHDSSGSKSASASASGVRSARERWLAVGAGVARFQGLAPEGVLGVPAFASIGRARGPRLRITFARTAEASAETSDGSSTFRWTAGRIDASPIRLVRGPLLVAPSIGVAAGVLDGRGTDVAMAAGGARPWIAPELALEVGARAGRFELAVEALASVPLVRDRFFIAPSTTVHETPWIATAIGVTLAVSVL